MLFQRHAAVRVLEALADTPVVLIHGARQVGKSTLVQQLIAEHHPARYITLDDLSALSAARSDPAGFLSGFRGPVALDEIQRAPELLPAVKAVVDRDRRPGRFLLTGSTNALLLPRLADFLVGRMEAVPLWPLSQSEVEGTRGDFIDRLFARACDDERGIELSCPSACDDRASAMERARAGGYPEALRRTSPSRRRAWFEAYLSTLLQRDVRELAQVDRLAELPRVLGVLASRATGLLNLADLSRTVGVPATTLRRYLSMFEATFLVHTLPAWSVNVGRRLTKSPKLMFSDTGLMAHLLGHVPGDSLSDLESLGLIGPLLENMVATELCKLATWSETRPALYHYRTTAGREVDVVLVGRRGTVVGIEVKAGASVDAGDFRGLRALGEDLGGRAGGHYALRLGVVLHCGQTAVPFGERLWALPISALWS